MSCELLAKAYASDTGIAIPNGASLDDRARWLLTQSWGCVINGQVEPDTTVCNNTPVQVGNFTTTGVPLTVLQEAGFMAWVNDRGMKCINRLTGIYVETLPDSKVPQPKVYCVGACYNVLPGQTACFECIKQTLENPENKLDTACPALYNGSTITNVDTSLMQASLQCHSCIANNSNDLLIPTQTVVDGQTVLGQQYNPSKFENIWWCVSPTYTLSVGAIIGIVIGVIVFVIAIVVLSVLLSQRARKRKEQKLQKMSTLSP